MVPPRWFHGGASSNGGQNRLAAAAERDLGETAARFDLRKVASVARIGLGTTALVERTPAWDSRGRCSSSGRIVFAVGALSYRAGMTTRLERAPSAWKYR